MTFNRLIGGLPNVNSFVASGSISAGDNVEFSGDNEVQQAPAGSEGEAGAGIAMYDVTDGQTVGVAQVGAEVDRVNMDNGIDAGDLVTADGTAGRLKEAGADDQVLGMATVGASGNEGAMLITGPGGIESET